MPLILCDLTPPGFKLHPQLCELLSGLGSVHARLLIALPPNLCTFFLRITLIVTAWMGLLRSPAIAARALHAGLASLALLCASGVSRLIVPAFFAQLRAVKRMWAVLRGRAPLPSLRDRLWPRRRKERKLPADTGDSAHHHQGIRAVVAAALLLMPLVLLLPTMLAYVLFYSAAAAPWDACVGAVRLFSCCFSLPQNGGDREHRKKASHSSGHNRGHGTLLHRQPRFEQLAHHALVTPDSASISFKLVANVSWRDELWEFVRTGAQLWWNDEKAGAFF